MEAIWFARRAALPCLAQLHPEWTHADQALAVGASERWVKQWLARLKHATTTDPTRYQARSRARQTPPPSTPRPVVEGILALRDEPPAHLRRVPGPRTIVAFLHPDPEALAVGVPWPRSPRTVWKVWRAPGRIVTDRPHPQRPLVPPAPLAEGQADCTALGPVPAEPDGKRLHAVEACLFAEGGSRQGPSVELRADFPAQPALEAVITCLRRTGLMGKLTGLPRPALGRRAQRAGFPLRPDPLPVVGGRRTQRLPPAAARSARLRRALDQKLPGRMYAPRHTDDGRGGPRSDRGVSRPRSR